MNNLRIIVITILAMTVASNVIGIGFDATANRMGFSPTTNMTAVYNMTGQNLTSSNTTSQTGGNATLQQLP